MTIDFQFVQGITSREQPEAQWWVSRGAKDKFESNSDRISGRSLEPMFTWIS